MYSHTNSLIGRRTCQVEDQRRPLFVASHIVRKIFVIRAWADAERRGRYTSAAAVGN